MVQVIVCAREVGGLKLEGSWTFDLPEIPAVGSYISINNPDLRAPLSEDFIVRTVWWRLRHPVTGSYPDEKEAERAGELIEIMVDCDKAIGPYASPKWRKSYEGRPGVEEFEIARLRWLGVPEDHGD